MSPLITILIPIANSEFFLKDMLDSIINQTYKNLEIICAINNSQDDSENIVKNYMLKDSRISITHSIGGLSGARNKGLELATGTYIAFIDSDDIVTHNFIEYLLKPFLDDSKIDISITHNIQKFQQLDNNVDLLGWDVQQSIQNQKNIATGNTYKVFDNNFIEKMSTISGLTYHTVWNKLYKVSFIKKNNMFFCEDKQNEDTVFNLFAIAASNRIAVLNISTPVIYYYRIHNKSITNSKKNMQPFDLYDTFTIYKNKGYIEKYIYSDSEKDLFYMFLWYGQYYLYQRYFGLSGIFSHLISFIKSSKMEKKTFNKINKNFNLPFKELQYKLNYMKRKNSPPYLFFLKKIKYTLKWKKSYLQHDKSFESILIQDIKK